MILRNRYRKQKIFHSLLTVVRGNKLVVTAGLDFRLQWGTILLTVTVRDLCLQAVYISAASTR